MALTGETLKARVHQQVRETLGLSRVAYLRLRFSQKRASWATAIAHPSLVSLVLSVIAGAVVVVVPMLVPSIWHWGSWQAGIQRIELSLQALLGFSVAALPILVFIIELTQDRGSALQPQVHVLIRFSYILPIIVTSISISVWLLCATILNAPVSAMQVALLVGLVAGFTIYSYGTTLRLLFNQEIFRAKAKRLVEERFGLSISTERFDRLCKSRFLQYLEDAGIEFTYSLTDKQEQSFEGVALGRSGVIEDVNLSRLEDLVAFIRSTIRAEHIEADSPPEPSASPEVIFAVNYGGLVTPDEALIYVRKPVNTSQKKEIVRSLAKTLLIGKSLEDRSAAQLDSSLEDVHAYVDAAVRESQEENVKVGLTLYNDLAVEFVDAIASFGGTYTEEQARHESPPFGGWRAIEGISENIKKSIYIAFQTPTSRDILRALAYAPFSFARVALNGRDHYIFQSLTIRVYGIWANEVLSRPNIEDHELLIDRLWRHPRDFLRYYVGPEFGRSKDGTDRGRLLGFYRSFIVAYSEMLKTAYDLAKEKGTWSDCLELIRRLGELRLDIDRELNSEGL